MRSSMDMATTAVDTAAGAVTITDGTEAAATTNGATIAVGKAFAVFAFVIPLPGRYANAATRTVAPLRRGRFSDPTVNDAADAQPSPISTAIRIRSE